MLALGVLVSAGLGFFISGADAEEEVQFIHIHGLDVPAWAPDELYVSTHHGLIRVDAEGKWRYVGDERHDLMGFRVHPTEQDVLYSSGHPGPGSGLRNPVGFMVSADGGDTWEPIALQGEADFHAMAVYPGDGNVIYGWNVGGGLYRSSDAGATWERLRAQPLGAVGGALALAVRPDDPNRLYAGTPDGLWRTQDGGESWEQGLAGLPVSAVSFFPGDADRLLIYAADRDAGLILIEDEGASRTPLDFVLDGDDAVFHIAIHPQSDEVIYLGSMRGNLFKTTDGGQSWKQLAVEGTPTGGR